MSDLADPRAEHVPLLRLSSVASEWRSEQFDATTRWTYARLMDWRDYITFEPAKRSGQPCIRGMRITVYDVLDYLAGGMSVDEFLDDFPDLTYEDLRACFAFSADLGRRVRAVPA